MAEEVKAPRAPKRVPKKKVCMFCVDHVEDIDYKDTASVNLQNLMPLFVDASSGSFVKLPIKNTLFIFFLLVDYFLMIICLTTFSSLRINLSSSD